MCNCIKELQDRLTAKMTSDEPDIDPRWKPKNGKLDHVQCQNMALMMLDFKSKLSVPFTAHWKVGEKRKETTIKVTASHCPFCGVEIE